MVQKISWSEYQKIKNLKELDLQWCDFCKRLNILNLGWEPFPKLLCQACQEEHVLCPELCLKVAKNIFDCHLYVEVPRVRPVRPVKPNRTYDLASCYLCSKELSGASKKSVIKHRNNPSFWGVVSEWKILCLKCLGKKYLNQLSKSKRKTYFKYLRRGYV